MGVSRATVLAAAHIKARFSISYADAFAVIAAQDRGGVVLTPAVAVAWLPRRRP